MKAWNKGGQRRRVANDVALWAAAKKPRTGLWAMPASLDCRPCLAGARWILVDCRKAS
jgi:hypothetical protein